MINKLLLSVLSFHLIAVNCDKILTDTTSGGPVVKTSSGKVRGRTLYVFNQSIDQFLGIPYAEPPVGSLRFAKPKPISKPIEGIIDAIKVKNSCIQPRDPNSNLTYSEDCLVLNIWSPKLDIKSSKLKPVMFWIYGGGLYSGSIFSLFYNGSVLATHDIVIVSVNYRLGYLGNLYGGAQSAPGNVGFFDQLLGLKWVKENVHSFGGDKNQITIFGESAGSWSVSAHIISPLSKGLFKRAIMESGAHMYNKDRPVMSRNEGLSNAKELAKRVNCTDNNQWLQCLRRVDPNLLIPIPSIMPEMFPIDGTEFLPISANKAFNDLSYNRDIDLLSGVTRDEGTSLGQRFFTNSTGNFTLKQFEQLVTFVNSIYHNIDTEKVTQFYLQNVDKNNSLALREALYNFFGDIAIKCPTYHFAKKFSEKTPNKKTYYYELTFEGPLVAAFGCDEAALGICHGADVPYVFGLPFLYQNLSSDLERNFSREVMKMWTNFAKNGDPGANWPQFDRQNSIKVKILDPRNLTGVLFDPFKEYCDGFWKHYFV